MKFFYYLIAAYFLFWLITILYVVSISKRQKDLSKTIQLLLQKNKKIGDKLNQH